MIGEAWYEAAGAGSEGMVYEQYINESESRAKYTRVDESMVSYGVNKSRPGLRAKVMQTIGARYCQRVGSWAKGMITTRISEAFQFRVCRSAA